MNTQDIMISTTAEQTGFGTAIYKRVVWLTPAERQFARDGGVVVYLTGCRSGGTHGTFWRCAVPYGRRFVPRVPDETILEVLPC